MWHSVDIIAHKKPKYVLWENVKAVTFKKHRHNFDNYLNEMNLLGYNNYWKVLNAKDFGIPQNRERMFVVSIRKDVDDGKFVMPDGNSHYISLKSFLEDEVGDKFYINSDKSEKLISEIIKNHTEIIKEGVDGTTNNPKIKETANCIVAGYDKGIASTFGTKSTMVIEKTFPCITPDRLNKRQNGRRIKGCDEPMFTLTAQDQHGILTVGRLDIEGHDYIKRVYSSEGVCPTLPTMQGGNQQPKVLVPLVDTKIRPGVRANFERDYEEIINSDKNIFKSECVEGFQDNKVGIKLCPTIRASNSHTAILNNYRIRKLTPRECWRLMGFSDQDFDKAQEVCSNSQLYKQAGNSIVVPVLEAIFKKLFESHE